MTTDSLELPLPAEPDTITLGQRLAAGLALQGGTLYLEGDLGAGKTTLARGLIQALGHSGAVKSPTYTIVEPYELGRPVYHFDLYRLADPEELELMGIRDYFAPGAICIIEWPVRGGDLIPAPDLQLTLAKQGSSRQARIQACTALGRQILQKIAL